MPRYLTSIDPKKLNILSHNHLLADIISLLGTTDFVLGSIDRLNS